MTESVWDYPRPPRVESSAEIVKLTLAGEVIARSTDTVRVDRGAWGYPQPTGGFTKLRNLVAVYPAALDRCTVDGEEVRAQAGGFYGGWVTDRVVGPFKGEPGTAGW